MSFMDSSSGMPTDEPARQEAPSSRLGAVLSILGFSPGSGTPGTRVTVTGSGFTGAGYVLFNGRESPAVTVVTDNRLIAEVPQGATSGPITISGPSGTASSIGAFSVIPLAGQPPIVTSFSPPSGATGTRVTLSGQNLYPASSVLMGGTSVPILSTTPSQVVVEVPRGVLSSRITVNTPVGSATSQGSFIVLQALPGPSISGFQPFSGPAGTQVIIEGDHFAGVLRVAFNGFISPAVSVVSNNRIIAQAPAGAGTGPLQVDTYVGTTQSAASFTVTGSQAAVPRVQGFSPPSAQAGTSILITGANFTGVTAVKFNGKDAMAFQVLSAGQLSAMVPLGATTGLVSVTSPAGTGTSNVAFAVLPGTVPGPRSLKKRGAGAIAPQTTDILATLRAGDVFTDELMAERFISGIPVLDQVKLTLEGDIPASSETLQPNRIFTFSGVSVLRVDSTPAVPRATYTLVVRGVSEIDGEPYDPIRYTVVIRPAVNISLNPAQPQVRQGNSASVEVVLDRSSKAQALPVTLTAEGLPAKVVPSFARNPLAAERTTLTLATSLETPLGRKSFQVTGAATFNNQPVSTRRGEAELNVKEPSLRLLIDPDKQSQQVGPGETAVYPFTLVRDNFDKPVFISFDVPDFALVDPEPSNPITGDSVKLTVSTQSTLAKDVQADIEVRARDDKNNLLAATRIRLEVLGALSLTIQDKEDAVVIAGGQPCELDVAIMKSQANRVVELFVVNAEQLRAQGIDATVSPSPTASRAASLLISTREGTAIGSYNVQVAARVDGQVLAFDSVDLLVQGLIQLSLDEGDLSTPAGTPVGTTLRVRRVGVLGLTRIRVTVNNGQSPDDIGVQVVVVPNPVGESAQVTLIPDIRLAGTFIPITFTPEKDHEGAPIMLRSASLFLDIQ